MKGTIVNFRGGRHTQYNNQMIILVDGVEAKDKAAELVGKKVIFTTEGGNELPGKVAAAHGNKGAVRVIFERGMPGQSVGKSVKLE